MDKLELYDKLEKVLEKDLAPALGCTEPMCFGLCAATARRYAPGEILSITVEATTVMLKGVAYVRIPNSGGQRGGKLSAAIGAVLDRMEDGMKIFDTATPEDVAKARALVDAGKVSIGRIQSPYKLNLQVTVEATGGTAKALTQVRHDNITYIEQNGKVIKDTRADLERYLATTKDDDVDYSVLSVENIYDFCKNAPLERFAKVEEAMRVNWAIAEDGMNTPYGIQMGRTLRDSRDSGVISDDLSSCAAMWAAAGVDARMGGSPFPAMTNSGSGNQGITSSVSVMAAGEYMGKSYEEIVRAVAVSSMMNMFVKNYCGKESARMASICCAALAAGGAGCGVAFMRGADADCLTRIMQTQLGTVAGLFCDGAKADCASKVSMAVNSAMQIAMVAEAGRGADEYNGIVGATVEDTIKNTYRLQSEGMHGIIETLFNIEMDKGHIC